MSNKHSSHLEIESNLISRRVEDSKKEIEQLKAEYDKLVQEGLNRKTEKAPDNYEEIDDNNENGFNTFRIESEADEPAKPKPRVSRKTTSLKSTRRSASVESKEKYECSPRKKRNYDVDQAREYMKKQKEKRLEQMKMQLKQTENTVEIRKRKLKELHQKSLKIIAKNTRERSKSRSRDTPPEMEIEPSPKTSQTLFINKPAMKTKTLKVPLISPLEIEMKNGPHLQTSPRIKPVLKPTPSRAPVECIVPPLQLEDLTESATVEKYGEQETKAATKIQSCFRTFLQRKAYKAILKDKLEKEERLRKKAEIDNRNEIISLFETDPDSYPYNFISIVKRKLNIAVTNSPKTTDVAIQSTPQHSQLSCKEIKEKIENSLKKSDASSKTNSIINELIDSSVKSIRSFERVSKTLDTNKEKLPRKSVSLRSFLYDKCVDLDLKNVESLKLQTKKSEQSDSDTSKNIPDLSSESSQSKSKSKSDNSKQYDSTFLSTQLTKQSSKQSPNSIQTHISTEITSKSEDVFKKPLDYSNLKINISKSKSSRDIKKSSESEDYKLEIDTERLKKLKLLRRRERTDLYDSMEFNESDDIIKTKSSPRDSIIASNKSNYTVSRPIESVRTSATSTKISLDKENKRLESNNENLIKGLSKSEELISNNPKSISSLKHSKSSNHPSINKVLDIINSIHSNKEILGNTSNVKSRSNSKKDNSSSSTSALITDIEYDSEARGDQSQNGSASSKENVKSSEHSSNKIKENSKQDEQLSNRSENRRSSRSSKSSQFKSLLGDNIKTEAHSKLDALEVRRQSIISSNRSNYSKSSEESVNNSEKSNKINLLKDTTDQLASFQQYMRQFDTSKKIKHGSSASSVDGGSKSVGSFKSLRSASSSSKQSDVDSEQYSSKFSNEEPLVPPSVSLQRNYDSDIEKGTKTIFLTADQKKSTVETVGNPNQIHVKFEAELHLLNDFNESLRQYMNIEKSLFNLQNKPTSFVTCDTQTSFVTKSTSTSQLVSNRETSHSITDELQHAKEKSISEQIDSVSQATSILTEKSIKEEAKQSLHPKPKSPVLTSINYSRGSDFYNGAHAAFEDLLTLQSGNEDKSIFDLKVDSLIGDNSLVISSGLMISEVPEISLDESNDKTMANASIILTSKNPKHMYAGLSLGMFEQLIKDEDARIENLKTILKIREKALLDRTKGELAWLEIQKKNLLETGKLHEASLVKKKQRGIIIKLQHEKQEMQKLKQIQKAASKERKTILREQRDMIKAQLSTTNTITKIKRTKGRASSGPIKVYNYHRETLQSETSISRRSSVAEEVLYASKSESIVSRISEAEATLADSIKTEDNVIDLKNAILNNQTEAAKRSLLMREAALQKRRKTAEQLLKWHQKLLEEERKIAELEMAASNIINQVPSLVEKSTSGNGSRYTFKGAQLNVLWENMTGRADKKFKDNETYKLSKSALERFCSEAKMYSNKNKEVLSTEEKPKSANKSKSEVELEKGIKQSESTLNEIMQNISNITDEISELYKLSSAKKSDQDILSLEEDIVLQLTPLQTTSDKQISYDIPETDISYKIESTNKSTTIHSLQSEDNHSHKDVPDTSIESLKNRTAQTNSQLSDFLVPSDKIELSIEEHINSVKTINSVSKINRISDEVSEENSISGAEVESDDESKIKSITSRYSKESALIQTDVENYLDKNDVGQMNIEINPESAIFTKSSPKSKSIINNENNLIIVNELNYNDDTSKDVSEAIISEYSDDLEVDSKQIDDNIDNFENSIADNIFKEIQDIPKSKSEIDITDIPKEEVDDESEKHIVSNTSSEYEESFQSVQEQNELEIKFQEQSLKSINENTSQIETDNNEIKSDTNSLQEQINEIDEEAIKSIIEEQIENDEQSNPLDEISLSNEHTSDNNYMKSSTNLENEFSRSFEGNLEHNERSSDHQSTISSNSIKSNEEQIKSIKSICDLTHKSVSENVDASTLSTHNNSLKSNREQIKSNLDITLKSIRSEIDDESTPPENSLRSNQEIMSNSEFISKSSKSNEIGNDIFISNNSIKSDHEQIKSENSERFGKGDFEEEKSALLQINNKLSHESQVEEDAQNDNSQSEDGYNNLDKDAKNSRNSSVKLSSVTSYKKIEDINSEENSSHITDLFDNDESVKSVGALSSQINEEVDENDDSVQYSEDLESEDVVSNIPIIGVTIEEKKDSKIVLNNKEPSNEHQLSKDEKEEDKNSFTESLDTERSAVAESTKSQVNVKQRVSEILADANINSNIGDKSPRVQDLYVTTYDVISPDNSPELGSPVENKDFLSSEAEELLRKQLAIEQEIKQLEQQQKEQLPYLYMREIPNKPPPPYTPPVQPIAVLPPTVLPLTIDQITTMTPKISHILHKAQEDNCLSSITLPEYFNINEVDRECCEFVFDLCKEIACEHYKQFEEISTVTWLKLQRNVGFKRKLDQNGLKNMIEKRLRQIFGFEKVEVKESMIIKWSRKKRDHVDELLVMESQAEETEWTNYNQDELVVKDEVTKDIMNLLLNETINVFGKIVAKKMLNKVC